MPDQVSLKEHLLALREADQRAIRTALDAANERFAAHNGLLDRMRERDASYASQSEVDLQFRLLNEKLDARGTLAVWCAVVGLLVGIGGLVAFVLSLTAPP